MKHDFYNFSTLKTYLALRKGVPVASAWLKESDPYWNALKNDNPEEWSLLPEKEKFWLVSDAGVLVEDTKWTAAAKCNAIKCLKTWKPDENLNRGQKIWGDTHFFGEPKHGGGNILHSIQHLTNNPEISYRLKDLVSGRWLDINQRTWDGLTPLHACGAYGYAPGVELLMQNGADMYILSNSGASALEMAAQYGRPETAIRMLSWGGWNLRFAQKERVLKAAAHPLAGLEMEEIFLRGHYFESVQQWVEYKMLHYPDLPIKWIQWANLVWDETPEPEVRRVLGGLPEAL